jgi:DNA-directed RNA polymerase subunit H (RpoH/RPB5)
MNNTNQQLFSIYQNIFSFYKYRNLIPVDDLLTQAEFAKKIQKDKYILLPAINKSFEGEVASISKYIDKFNEKSSTKNITVFYILLIYPGTDSESKRANMMKFVNHVRYPKADVIIITPTKLSNSVIKGLVGLNNTKEHKYHNFKSYTYNLLTTVVPEFELTPKYNILSESEISELQLDVAVLPKIFENDPPMVWIGARVGQIICFKYLSETTINAIGYCVVVPMTN